MLEIRRHLFPGSARCRRHPSFIYAVNATWRHLREATWYFDIFQLWYGERTRNDGVHPPKRQTQWVRGMSNGEQEDASNRLLFGWISINAPQIYSLQRKKTASESGPCCFGPYAHIVVEGTGIGNCAYRVARYHQSLQLHITWPTWSALIVCREVCSTVAWAPVHLWAFPTECVTQSVQ